jgi:hypothetical protein
MREQFQKNLKKIIKLSSLNEEKEAKGNPRRTITALVLQILSILPLNFRVHFASIFVGAAHAEVKGFSQLLLSAAEGDESACSMLRQLSLLNPTVLDLFSFEESQLLKRKPKIDSPEGVSNNSLPDIANEPPTTSSSSTRLGDVDYEDGEIRLEEFTAKEEFSKTDDFSEDEEAEAVPSNYVRVSGPNRTFVTSVEETREIYANINNKFGLGMKFESPEAQSTILNLQELAKRSIRHLSTELYSEDIHSILELTQNSDDNSYASHEIPKLSIRLTDNPLRDKSAYPFTLTFINNEIGFSQENVNAICDISKSTKSMKDPGYIGHKGIGFKSVFKLTDIPEVHSNYFHFQFDSRQDILGYILPKQLPAPADWDERRDKTMIVLPLRMKDDFTSTEALLLSVCEHLKDLSPALLLFLHRLRCLEISFSTCDEAAQIAGWRSRRYSRVDQPSDSIVQILITERSLCNAREDANGVREEVHKWLVWHHKMAIEDDASKSTTTEISVAFRVDQIVAKLTHSTAVRKEKRERREREMDEKRSLQPEEGEEIESDEFSIDEEDSFESTDDLDQPHFVEKWLHFVRVYQQFNFTLECHPVFAFLPLRSYGFRFMLQADWKVTSSREAVDSSSKRNLQIRDEIPAAFVQTLRKFIEYATKDEILVSVRKSERMGGSNKSISKEDSDLEDGEILSSEESENSIGEVEERIEKFSDDALLCLNLIFHLIPAKNQVVEFFSCVPPLISQSLLSLKFIPTNESTFELPRNVVLHPLNERAISLNTLTGADDSFTLEKARSVIALSEREMFYIGVSSTLLKKAKGLAFTNPFVIIPQNVVSELNLKFLNSAMLIAVLDCFKEIEEEEYANGFLVWILEQLYSFLDLSLIEKLMSYEIIPFFNNTRGRMQKDKKFFYFGSENNQKNFRKYEAFLSDCVLDSDFALKLRQNERAQRMLIHCIGTALSELNDHSFYLDVALKKFASMLHSLLLFNYCLIDLIFYVYFSFCSPFF